MSLVASAVVLTLWYRAELASGRRIVRCKRSPRRTAAWTGPGRWSGDTRAGLRPAARRRRAAGPARPIPARTGAPPLARWRRNAQRTVPRALLRSPSSPSWRAAWTAWSASGRAVARSMEPATRAPASSAVANSAGSASASGRRIADTSSPKPSSRRRPDALMSQPGLPAPILTAAQAEPSSKPLQMLDKRVWPLRIDLGLKAVSPVTGHVQIDAADLSQQPPRRAEVAEVARAAAGRVVFLMAQVLGQFLTQCPLSTALVTCDSSPSGPRSSAPWTRARRAAVGKLLVDQRRITVGWAGLAGHHVSVSHLVIPSESNGLRVRPRSLTQPV